MTARPPAAQRALAHRDVFGRGGPGSAARTARDLRAVASRIHRLAAAGGALPICARYPSCGAAHRRIGARRSCRGLSRRREVSHSPSQTTTARAGLAGAGTSIERFPPEERVQFHMTPPSWGDSSRWRIAQPPQRAPSVAALHITVGRCAALTGAASCCALPPGMRRASRRAVFDHARGRAGFTMRRLARRHGPRKYWL